MDVLQRWLNDEVGLSKHITNFEKDFANGYFFGEIFSKFNLQPDFRSFLNFHSMDSKMNNFARLEPVLRVLDVKVPSKTLNEIMEEKKGVAARMLLSVKAALENISEEDRRRANTPTSLPPLSRGSTNLQQQQQQDNFISSSSLQSSFHSSQQFTASPPHRTSESAGQHSPKRHTLRTSDSEPASNTPQPAEKDQPPSLQDVKPINVKIDKHQVDLKYQQYLEEKARRKKMKQTAEATHDVMSGIENFEKSLKNFTYEDPQQAQNQNQNQNQNTTMNTTTNRKPPATTTTRRVGLSSSANIPLPPADEEDEDSKKYMQKIKKKKDEEQIARQERDKRRRKILVEQQQVQKALDDKQNEEMLLEKLLRQSKEERRIAARIVETRNKAKEVRKNRVLREEQYASLRQKEFELLLEKDAQLGRAAKLEYELKAKLDRELFEQYEARRRVVKQDKHYSVCARIVDYFVDIAFKVVEYKKLTDGQTPVKEMREWKTLFKSGVPLFPPKKQISAITVPLMFSSYEAEDEHDSILNERDFLDYLKGKEEWALSFENNSLYTLPLPPPSHPSVSSSTTLHSSRGTSSQQPNRPVSPSVSRPVSPSQQPSHSHLSHVSSSVSQFNPLSLIGVPQNNELLGKIISYLFSLSLPKDPPPPPPVMPNFNFKICLVGKHLAGKSSILKKLAESYRVTLISVNQLVSKAIEESKNSEVPTEFTELGIQCAQAIDENKEIGNEILVKLIVREINEIARINDEEERGNSGWVLEGFPETVTQAQLLEKALTGYEPPPSPKAKKVRSKKKLVEKASKKRASQIAQPPAEESAPSTAEASLKSGIDLVIHVSVSDDTIIRRSVGRRIDPTTGITYHLEYNPPPEHKGVHGRLVPVETGDTSILYQKMSSFKDELPKLEKWFSRFNNFKEVNGELPTEEIVNEIESFIQQSPPIDTPQKMENGEKHLIVESPTAENRPLTSSPLPTFHLTQTDSEVTTKQESFDMDLACILIERFLDMEASYTTTAKTIFCRVRKERKTILHHLSQLRDDFLMYLKRPHTMQQYIDPFQQSFNEIENDMRRDVETKQELHQRTDDLRDKLWEISDIRKAEAEAERKTTNEDGWLEGRIGVLTNTYISLMQLEVDRFFESKRLMKDFFSGCRKMPLEDANQPVIELPLIGASPQNSVTINTSMNTLINTNIVVPSDDLVSTGKPASRGGSRKKKEPTSPSRGNSMNALPVANASTVVPTSPKASKPISAPARKTKKKPAGEPIINRYDNEPFPDLYIAYCMAQNLVFDADKKDEPFYGQAFEDIDVGQALQLEDRIFLSRLERIKDRGVRVLKDTKEQSEKLAAKEEDWLGKRFLTEMNAISALTRLVKDTVEREKKLPYFFHLVDDEFIIEEDMLVFEPELAPPPPMPQELTYPDRFSSDQITALTQRFSLVAPWTLISVKDCAELLFSLCATSELGFEFLPFEWQDLDLAQFTKLVKSFIRVEAGTPNYIPNSTTPSGTNTNISEFIDWREFLVFCVFSGSISSPPSLLVSSASNNSSKNLNYTQNNNMVKSGSSSKLSNSSLLNNNTNNSIINTDGSENNRVSTPTFVLPPLAPLPISSNLNSISQNNNSAPPSAHVKVSSSPSTPSSAKTNDDQSPEIPNENGLENIDALDGAPQSNRFYFGNFVSPSPPSMTQLAEMKAAFRGVDTDNDGKVTYVEYLKVPLWFESVTSEFSSPQQQQDNNDGTSSRSNDEAYSFFAQKLKRAIFHIFRQPPIQSEEINFNRGNRIFNEAPFSRNRSFYGTPKVDYMEFLAYLSADWNEGEGIRKAIWISSDPPGRPLDLQKLVFLLHTQYSAALLNEPARQLLYTISNETQTPTSEPATLEVLLSSPTGRALVERAYERFTLKNVKSFFQRLTNASTGIEKM